MNPPSPPFECSHMWCVTSSLYHSSGVSFLKYFGFCLVLVHCVDVVLALIAMALLSNRGIVVVTNIYVAFQVNRYIDE